MEAMSNESPPVTNQPLRRLERVEYDDLVAHSETPLAFSFGFDNQLVEGRDHPRCVLL